MNYKLFLKRYFPHITYYLLLKKKTYIKDRIKVLNHLGINILFDVGANIGRYAHLMRYAGFKGKIFSFEPLTDAYQYLRKWAEKDANWLVFNFALGEKNDEITINVSRNSVSSSILKINDYFSELVPEARYVSSQKAECRLLSSVIKEFCKKDDRIFVKLDTQGYEKIILESSQPILDKISVIQLEMQFRSVYEGDTNLLTMMNWLESQGFLPVSIEPGWVDARTGYMVETDGLFIRKDLINC